MKAGKVVWYEGQTEAVVVAVTGSGASGYKTLTLDVGGKLKKDVPHQNDAAKGYWTHAPVAKRKKR